MPTKPITDDSEHNPDIDWDAAAPHIGGAVHRVGSWRLSAGGSRDDAKVARNADECRRLDVIQGGYQRALPWANGPEAECVLFHHRLTKFELLDSGCYIPAIDVEPTGAASDKGLDAHNLEFDAAVDWPKWVRTFVACWEDVSHGLPLRFYSSGSFFDGRYGGVLGLPLWVQLWAAHWFESGYIPEKYKQGTREQWAGNTTYVFGGRTTMHQYSSKGNIPGFTGNVDLNCLMPYTSIEEVTL